MREKLKKHNRYHVYIIQCKDNTYYTGYTNDLDKRLKEHGGIRGAKYTRARKPVKLLWHKEYKYFKRAVLEERRIKKLRRYQKEKLVYGE